MILLIKKKTKKPKGQTSIWYDPFFQESVSIECEGYTIRTKHSPYCVVDGKPIKIEKAIKLFKEHNKIKYKDEYVLTMMKRKGIVYYGYLQEPEAINGPKEEGLSRRDFNKITRILDNLEINYDNLEIKSEGITVEIEENDEVESLLEDFLLEINREYEYKEK